MDGGKEFLVKDLIKDVFPYLSHYFRVRFDMFESLRQFGNELIVGFKRNMGVEAAYVQFTPFPAERVVFDVASGRNERIHP